MKRENERPKTLSPSSFKPHPPSVLHWCSPLSPILSIQPIRWPTAEVPPRQLGAMGTHTHTHTHLDKRPFRRRVIASMAMGKEGREQVSLWIKPRLLTSPWRWHLRSPCVSVCACDHWSGDWVPKPIYQLRERDRERAKTGRKTRKDRSRVMNRREGIEV